MVRHAVGNPHWTQATNQEMTAMASDNPDLELLLERSKALTMTEAQQAAQRRSFAFGNTAFENPLITREMVEEAARRLGY